MENFCSSCSIQSIACFIDRCSFLTCYFTTSCNQDQHEILALGLIKDLIAHCEHRLMAMKQHHPKQSPKMEKIFPILSIPHGLLLTLRSVRVSSPSSVQLFTNMLGASTPMLSSGML
ncbi:unnamed protein product [Cuscuta campestris]|uniref:Uncharacterized protein n=1 Tax=Cuscuta campestris TaxID=132261 RepID=A0A484KS31_9ASTE|nr:unnamed protein product [Cuscuta campestris]